MISVFWVKLRYSQRLSKNPKSLNLMLVSYWFYYMWNCKNRHFWTFSTVSQYIGSWLIFGFLSWYPKFWFGKILADLNPIYKIPKLHISSVHPTNFQSSYISLSDTLSIIWYLAKYWRFGYALCKGHVVVCRRLDQDRYLPQRTGRFGRLDLYRREQSTQRLWGKCYEAFYVSYNTYCTYCLFGDHHRLQVFGDTNCAWSFRY